MSKVRAESLCPTCSGNSNLYFLKEKALITQEVCSSTMKECASYLGFLEYFMMNLSNVIQQLSRIRVAFRGYNIQLQHLGGAQSSIFKIISEDIYFLIDEYIKYRKLQDSKSIAKLEQMLCARILSLVEVPFIIKVDDQFRFAYYSYRLLFSQAHSLLKKTDNTYYLIGQNSDNNSWKATYVKFLDSKNLFKMNWGRQLQITKQPSNFIESPESLLVSDTIVFPFSNGEQFSQTSVSITYPLPQKLRPMDIKMNIEFP